MQLCWGLGSCRWRGIQILPHWKENASVALVGVALLVGAPSGSVVGSIPRLWVRGYQSMFLLFLCPFLSLSLKKQTNKKNK